jgi:hypothetical protein
MYSSTLLTIALATAALSQSTSTVPGITQISDGQIQAPTDAIPSGPGPEIISTSLPYDNPFTSYLTETNSLGVITGMPSVVTSQPAVVTSQPVSPTLPSYSGYAYGNSTTVGVSGTASTLATATVSATLSESATAISPTIGQSTGGADVNRVAGCGVALVVLGVGFSLL